MVYRYRYSPLLISSFFPSILPFPQFSWNSFVVPFSFTCKLRHPTTKTPAQAKPQTQETLTQRSLAGCSCTYDTSMLHPDAGHCPPTTKRKRKKKEREKEKIGRTPPLSEERKVFFFSFLGDNLHDTMPVFCSSMNYRYGFRNPGVAQRL